MSSQIRIWIDDQVKSQMVYSNYIVKQNSWSIFSFFSSGGCEYLGIRYFHKHAYSAREEKATIEIDIFVE